ncbi:MAG: Crp/Fnr family transcriptional regulator [Hornefia sp.]|nr:Crp/Fnr family transcriptional regulator [Hornefia sp.]
MKKVNVLDNISQEELDRIVPCFNPITRRYLKGETILTYQADIPREIGILTVGEARLEASNETGDVFYLEDYHKGDIFGELFSLPLENFLYTVVALSDCTVTYLDYNHVITPCEKSCSHHSQLISNLFLMTAQKSQEMSLHISILGQVSIRNKIMTYLKHIRSISKPIDDAGTFNLPISLVQLSEYIMVDRTAMMREIRAMKKDGLIESKSRQFRILN